MIEFSKHVIRIAIGNGLQSEMLLQISTTLKLLTALAQLLTKLVR